MAVTCGHEGAATVALGLRHHSTASDAACATRRTAPPKYSAKSDASLSSLKATRTLAGGEPPIYCNELGSIRPCSSHKRICDISETSRSPSSATSTANIPEHPHKHDSGKS